VKLAKTAQAVLGMSLLGLTACGGAAPPTVVGSGSSAPMSTYAEASCSTLHGTLAKVEHDAVQQEQFVEANPSSPVSVIAEAWLPPGIYSKDLQTLAALIPTPGTLGVWGVQGVPSLVSCVCS
jgi:hypothetical protein